MPRVRISDLAKFGVIKDIENTVVPPNAWTDAINVRFRDGKMLSSKGHRTTFGAPSVKPYWLLQTVSPNLEIAWIYAGLTKVFTFISGTHYDISRAGAAYAAQEASIWNGGVLAGIPVINNFIDVPQYWANVAGSQKLQDLANWPPAWRARIIRPYKNFLVALDLIESGQRYVHRVRWSHPAQPFGIPSSWDDLDPTKDAGISDLTDVQNGPVVDGLLMEDKFIIYKERSIQGMQFQGGNYKMRIYPIFNDVGALGDHCISVFGDPARHFVFTGEDIIQHDGQTLTSVIDKQIRRWIQTVIDTAYYDRSYTVAYRDEGECWCCIPTMGYTWPNLAIIWNFKDGSITYRDLDCAAFMWPGNAVSDQSDSWDSDSASWDSDRTQWNSLISKQYQRQLLQANPDDQAIFVMDTGNDFNGVPFNCRVERTGLSVVDVSNDGTPISDTDVRKLVRGLWIQGSGGPIAVTIGRQHEVAGDFVWGTSRTFTPGQFGYIGCLDDTPPLDCRTYAVKFEWGSLQPGIIQSYDIDVEALGSY